MEGMRRVEVVRAACCVAGCDGIADEQEMKILQMLAEEVGVGRASMEAMIDRGINDEEYCADQFRVLKSDPTETMQLLFSVALSDAVLTSKEQEVLWCIAQRLEVSREQFEIWLSQAKNALHKMTQ